MAAGSGSGCLARASGPNKRDAPTRRRARRVTLPCAPESVFSILHCDLGINPSSAATIATTSSGTVTIENVTTGKTVSKALKSSVKLCLENAEWCVLF